MRVLSKDLQILGHKVTTEGRFPTEKGTEAISNFPPPRNASVGMISYFLEYIPNMSTKTQHLRTLLSKKASFSWTPQHEAEFQNLKNELISPDIMLVHPDFDKSFEVHTDASKFG